jgi:hypothetical protein
MPIKRFILSFFRFHCSSHLTVTTALPSRIALAAARARFEIDDQRFGRQPQAHQQADRRDRFVMPARDALPPGRNRRDQHGHAELVDPQRLAFKQ